MSSNSQSVTSYLWRCLYKLCSVNFNSSQAFKFWSLANAKCTGGMVNDGQQIVSKEERYENRSFLYPPFPVRLFFRYDMVKPTRPGKIVTSLNFLLVFASHWLFHLNHCLTGLLGLAPVYLFQVSPPSERIRIHTTRRAFHLHFKVLKQKLSSKLRTHCISYVSTLSLYILV
jgi:hypothetical protein